jgi:hypothetical protein
MYWIHWERKKSKTFCSELVLQNETKALPENIPFYGPCVTLNDDENVHEYLRVDIA